MGFDAFAQGTNSTISSISATNMHCFDLMGYSPEALFVIVDLAKGFNGLDLLLCSTESSDGLILLLIWTKRRLAL